MEVTASLDQISITVESYDGRTGALNIERSNYTPSRAVTIEGAGVTAGLVNRSTSPCDSQMVFLNGPLFHGVMSGRVAEVLIVPAKPSQT